MSLGAAGPPLPGRKCGLRRALAAMEQAEAHNGSGAAEAPTAGTRPPATAEGMALAYGSLVVMALLPIFFGALRSVTCAKGKVSRRRRRRRASPGGVSLP